MSVLKAKVIFKNEREVEQKGSKEYDYLTLEKNLEKGDLVVVETRYGYSVAEFVKYSETQVQKSKSFIVQKLDVSLLEKEKERQAKISELSEQIAIKAKEVLQRQKLDALAKDDKELKAMLDSLDSLELDK